MEKYDAKRYRRTLWLRILFYMLMFILALSLLVASVVIGRETATGDFIHLVAMLMVFFCRRLDGGESVNLIEALWDEKTLRKAWYAEHDERRMIINARAGIPLMSYTAIVLAVMGMLFSLWEDGIGFGIILAALFVHLFSACACWYWQRKLTNEEEETNDEP
ncbi:MAG: hypothetical protein E7327_07070 [Clostridiales bacterium]|nr:hypothetical protein [Clostridiales bacterium]